MSRCYLIRHADAGVRGTIADDQRELTNRGRRQADAIAAALGDEGLDAVVSSPFTRCIQSVTPLATAAGLAVVADDCLGEGSGPERVLELLENGGSIALCSHGDVLGEVLSLLHQRGVPLDDDRLAKASTWIVTVRDGVAADARYVAPPR